MYCNVDGDLLENEIINSLTPDLTIYLDTPLNVLIKRLIPEDPKYEFRYNNIINSNKYFEEAFVNLEKRGYNIIRVDGDQGPRSIEKIIMDDIMNRDILNQKGPIND